VTIPGTVSAEGGGRAWDGAPDVIELAQGLIRTPSPNPPGDERAVAAFLAEAVVAYGLPPARVVAKDPRRPNLVTTLDFGPGGRHLVLSGHIDTSLLGGRGSLVGTPGGVTLLALVESSFTLLQLPATLTNLIRGVVILAAAAIFVARARR
jgi:hypothetical protein